MIFATLAYVPKMKPAIPNNIIKISFHNIHLYLPISGQNVIISINGGNINANVELLSAPTNEITTPKFGTNAAKTTEK